MKGGAMKKRKQKMLQYRIDERWFKSGAGDKLFLVDHVRAELERLARQVRKLDTTLGAFYGAGAVVIRKSDVLALLKEAKK